MVYSGGGGSYGCRIRNQKFEFFRFLVSIPISFISSSRYFAVARFYNNNKKNTFLKIHYGSYKRKGFSVFLGRHSGHEFRNQIGRAFKFRRCNCNRIIDKRRVAHDGIFFRKEKSVCAGGGWLWGGGWDGGERDWKFSPENEWRSTASRGAAGDGRAGRHSSKLLDGIGRTERMLRPVLQKRFYTRFDLTSPVLGSPFSVETAVERCVPTAWHECQGSRAFNFIVRWTVVHSLIESLAKMWILFFVWITLGE